jgi:hypothetical protein
VICDVLVDIWMNYELFRAMDDFFEKVLFWVFGGYSPGRGGC